MVFPTRTRDEGNVADRNEDVMNMVTSELEKKPDIGLESLYARAKAIDPGVGELSLRQFHARYPLQVKRQKSRAEGRTPKRSTKKRRGAARGASDSAAQPGRNRKAGRSSENVDREKLRALFLEFASEFAAAESRAEIVGVLSSVDGYVDRVAKLSAG
jgi:hypothetical protein